MFKDGRVGKFRIHRDLISDEEAEDTLKELFSRVIVLRAEMMAASNSVEYIAWSDEFDKLEVGDAYPEYRVETLCSPVGNTKFILAMSFVRQK